MSTDAPTNAIEEKNDPSPSSDPSSSTESPPAAPQDAKETIADSKEEEKVVSDPPPQPQDNKENDDDENDAKESESDDKKDAEESKSEEKKEEKPSEPSESKTDDNKEEEDKPVAEDEKAEAKPTEEEKVEESKKGDDSSIEAGPEEKEDDKTETDETPKKEPEEEQDQETPVKGKGSRVRKLLGDFLITPGSNENTPSGKRTRKSVERHEPGVPKRSKDNAYIPGRGEKLSAIPSVEKLIQKRPRTDTVLKDAHRLLYGFGKKKIAAPKVTVVKKLLLEYSGFLYADSAPEEDVSRIEKFKAYAMKMTLPSLREICDLFDLDRSQVTKETVVDRLADFLSIPDEKYTKTFAKTASKKKASSAAGPTTKKRKTATNTPTKGTKRRKKAENSDVADEKPEDNAEDEVADPSEDQLREWVHHYVNCFDLDKATTKHAIETVSDKFGKNLAHKKQRIKQLLADELNKM